MTEDSNKPSGEGGLMSSAWSLGAAAWNYASQTVSKYVSSRVFLFLFYMCIFNGVPEESGPLQWRLSCRRWWSGCSTWHSITIWWSRYILDCSFMGYEELNVIDPTTGKPVKAETDMSDVRLHLAPLPPSLSCFDMSCICTCSNDKRHSQTTKSI